MPMFPKVLVVDDSPVDRQIVGGLLEMDPFIQVQYAESGRDALAKIEKDIPKLILTDLVMPEMDGLEFVKTVVARHAVLPVVLMTAHGSGAVAAEALRQGAASYIPKSQLADRLLGTVQRLLGMVRGQHNYERLVEYQQRVEYEFSLKNKASLIDPVIGLVHDAASSARFSDARGRLQMAVALEQALLNAMYHGNLEIDAQQQAEAREQAASGKAQTLVDQRKSQSPYCDRRIDVSIRITRQEARLVIRDEGPGFDVESLPSLDDPTLLERQGGQGLVLMVTFMDEVHFNRKGNEVVMVKRQPERTTRDQRAHSAMGAG
jgi:CheY-like chemotaxis protein